MDHQLIRSNAWPAPAKLNLCLHIVGRRADGYHLLQTAFQFVDLCDLLDFEITAGGSIERAHQWDDVPPDRDLTLRAARLLQQETSCSRGAVVTCHKVIPIGGGLGGGSSDAATVLVALNLLWNTGLSVDALADLGLRLGADVPVFVRGHAAWAEGIGERLTPIQPPEPWYVILHPQVHVSTAEIFQAPELTRNHPIMKIRDFFAGQGVNDCETVVRVRHPAVNEALNWGAQFGPTRLTGTGACVFTAFTHEADARAMQVQTPTHWRSFVARGMNRSPLLEHAAHGRQFV